MKSRTRALALAGAVVVAGGVGTALNAGYKVLQQQAAGRAMMTVSDETTNVMSETNPGFQSVYFGRMMKAVKAAVKDPGQAEFIGRNLQIAEFALPPGSMEDQTAVAAFKKLKAKHPDITTLGPECRALDAHCWGRGSIETLRQNNQRISKDGYTRQARYMNLP